jgi:TatD DNase family protein
MPEYMDLTEVLDRAREAGVSAIIDVGFDLPSSKASVRLSNSYSQIFSAVGIHPHDAQSVKESDIDELKKLALERKVVAIGEAGLDYYRNLSPKESQISLFKRHIALAQETSLPLIVHSRDAHDDTLRILHEENSGSLRGVMHCFSGDYRVAKLSLDLGFYISFAGPLTFKNASEIREVAKSVPIERILIETDCPYLSPDPFRGTRNEPSYIVRTAEKLAQVKGIPLDEMNLRIAQNVKELFTKITI